MKLPGARSAYDLNDDYENELAPRRAAAWADQDRAVLLERVRQIAGIRKLDQLPLSAGRKWRDPQTPRLSDRNARISGRKRASCCRRRCSCRRRRLPAAWSSMSTNAEKKPTPRPAAASSNSSSAAPACWRWTSAARAGASKDANRPLGARSAGLAGRFRLPIARPVLRGDACRGRLARGPLCHGASRRRPGGRGGLDGRGQRRRSRPARGRPGAVAVWLREALANARLVGERDRTPRDRMTNTSTSFMAPCSNTIFRTWRPPWATSSRSKTPETPPASRSRQDEARRSRMMEGPISTETVTGYHVRSEDWNDEQVP